MEYSTGESLFSKQIHPKIQAFIALGGVIIFSGIGKAIGLGSEEMAQRFPWMISAAFMLVFAIFNSVFWISAKESKTYLTQSIIWYALLALGAGVIAFLISGISPEEAGSIKAIFIILTIGYTVFMGIMGTIKFLIGFLNKEEKNKIEGKQRVKRRRRQ